MGRRKANAWGIGIIAFMICGLCGTITSACDDDDPPPSRPVEQTSAPVTSAPVKVAPTTTATTTPNRATTAKPKPSPSRTTTKPKPSPSRTTTKPKPPSSDPRYGTCREANAHGLGPYYEGADPEYDWYQDRDGDGVVCER